MNFLKTLDMMISKDGTPEIISEDDLSSKDGQIYYIPRAMSSSGNGKKRGAILSWALPTNRM
jgi:hypothetical protein